MVLPNSNKSQLNILKKLSSKIRLKSNILKKPLMTIRMGEDTKKGKLTEAVSKHSVIIYELLAFYDHKMKLSFLN